MRWLRGVFFKWITGVGLLAILLSTWLAIKLTTNSRTADSTRELALGLWSESPASLTANSAVVVVGEVIILVHSRINSTLRRNAIRETWLAPRMLIGYSVQYRFLIGGLGAKQVEIRTLDTEQQDHGDLLVLWDVSNSYSSLSNRTLQSMVFINRHYNFSFMLKTDDDVFLNTQRILKDLKTHLPTHRLYWGRSSCYNPLINKGQWRETKWHFCDTYFPYNYGGMYVLSKDLVNLIAENAPYLQTYTCEDVSVGAWLAPYNIVRVDDVRIFSGHNSGRCSRGFIAVHINHYLAHKQMKRYYNKLRRKGSVCSSICKEQPISWSTITSNCYKKPIPVTK